MFFCFALQQNMLHFGAKAMFDSARRLRQFQFKMRVLVLNN